MTVTGTSAPLAILPSADLRREIDGDGRCEDGNGNGRADHADVVRLFNSL